MRRGAPCHSRRVSVTPWAPLPLPGAPPAEHPPLVTLLMSVWGFLERELVGNASASQAGASTGAKLKPQHLKSCWKCWGEGIFHPKHLPAPQARDFLIFGQLS